MGRKEGRRGERTSLPHLVAANCYDSSTAYKTTVASALAQINPIPSGPKLTHIGEQPSHPGLPLQLAERDGLLQKAIQLFQELNCSLEVVWETYLICLSGKCFKVLNTNPSYCPFL